MQLSLERSSDNHDSGDACVTPRNNESFLGASFDSRASASVSRSLANRSVSSRTTVLHVGQMRRDGHGGNASALLARPASRCGSAGGRAVPHDASLTLADFSFFSSPGSTAAGSPTSVAEASFEEGDGDDGTGHDCVEIKLNEALRLQRARALGLKKESLTLANYAVRGEQYVVKELVKAALSWCLAEPRRERDADALVDAIRAFAEEGGADVDAAARRHADELCDAGGEGIARVARRTRALYRWCASPLLKCRIALRTLRRARVSAEPPPDLAGLAREAIEVAAASVAAEEENIRSELEEAARLLAIDALVRKYCGNGAQEYFSAVSVTIVCIVVCTSWQSCQK